MPTPASTPGRLAGRMPVAVCLTLLAGAWIAHLFLRATYQPGHPLRLLVSAVLIACVALLGWAQTRAIRSQDEFARTVHAAALAIAFPTSVVAAVALGYAHAEGVLTHTDPHDLPALMAAIWAASLALAWRRYR